MNKLGTIIGLMLVGLAVLLVTLHTFTSPSVQPRLIKVVVTGPKGQHFSGRYVADGVTNVVSAIAPATISLEAQNVAYEFQRDGGDGEFRVALFVENSCRTSATADQRKGVRGELSYTSNRENYWAAGF